jgi:hypothetical protein
MSFCVQRTAKLKVALGDVPESQEAYAADLCGGVSVSLRRRLVAYFVGLPLPHVLRSWRLTSTAEHSDQENVERPQPS